MPWGNSERLIDKYKLQYPDKSETDLLNIAKKNQKKTLNYPLINLYITLILIRIMISLQAKHA